MSLGDTPTTWHPSIDDLPNGPAIIIANEFFDALPLRQYVLTGEGLCERVVGLGVKGFVNALSALMRRVRFVSGWC